MTIIELRKKYQETTGKKAMEFNIMTREYNPTTAYAEYLEDQYVDNINSQMDDCK